MSSVDKAQAPNPYREMFTEAASEQDAASSSLQNSSRDAVLRSLLSKLKPIEEPSFQEAPEAPLQQAAPGRLQQAEPEQAGPSPAEPQEPDTPLHDVRRLAGQPALPDDVAAREQPQTPLAQSPLQEMPRQQAQPQPQPASQSPLPPKVVAPQQQAGATRGQQTTARSSSGASSAGQAVYRGASVAASLESIFGDIPITYTIQFRTLTGGDGGVSEQQLMERIQKAQQKGDAFGRWLSGYLNPWRSPAATAAVRTLLPNMVAGPRANLDPRKLTQELARDLSAALAMAAGAIAKDWQRCPLTASQRQRLDRFNEVLSEVMLRWPPQADLDFQALCQLWLDAILEDQAEVEQAQRDADGQRVDADGRNGGGGGQPQDESDDEARSTADAEAAAQQAGSHRAREAAR